RGSRSPTQVVLPDAQGSVWLCEECQARRLRFPKTAADYLIEEWIGGGGRGGGFLAGQRFQKNPPPPQMKGTEKSTGEKASAYFRREIEALRDLLMPGGQSHHSIVSFYEIYEVDSQFQLVMEYVDGKNAHEWVNDLEGPLPIASGARIGRHLMQALE